jgi:hypothetical protein
VPRVWPAALVALAVVGGTASATATKRNGLVSLGACCAGRHGIYLIKPEHEPELFHAQPAWQPN